MTSTPAEDLKLAHDLALLDRAMKHPDFPKAAAELSQARAQRLECVRGGFGTTPALDATIVKLSKAIRAMGDL